MKSMKKRGISMPFEVTGDLIWQVLLIVVLLAIIAVIALSVTKRIDFLGKWF